MVVTDVRTCHVLVLNSGDTLADLLTLHTFHQCNQVVEDTCFARAIALEVTRPLVGQLTKFGVVILHAHQLVALVSRDILALFLPGIEVGLFGLDPQQVGTVLQAGDAVQHHAIFPRARLELVETRG